MGKSWGKSCDIFNWGSLLSTGHTLELVFLIWGVFQGAVVPQTKADFWKIMAWSFRCLFAGKHPSENWLGEACDISSKEGRMAGLPLVGDASDEDFPFCVLWVIKGDLDWYQKAHMS